MRNGLRAIILVVGIGCAFNNGRGGGAEYEIVDVSEGDFEVITAGLVYNF